MLRASLITSEPGFVFMIQLTPAEPGLIGADKTDVSWVHDLVERAPDAFVVVDADGVIRFTNAAFLELAEVGTQGAVIGQRLDRWLWQPGADLSALLSNVRQYGFMRLFQTTMHGELGTVSEVEVSAVGNGDKPNGIGLLMRDVTRRLPDQHDSDQLRAALQSSTEQIGRTPLRSLVKNTVGIVEEHFMRAALELSGNNRTAAAEMLGLSRQSLYSKLNRYGLDENKAALKPTGD
jgi:transcriptional regulator PpsR